MEKPDVNKNGPGSLDSPKPSDLRTNIDCCSSGINQIPVIVGYIYLYIFDDDVSLV